MKILMITFDLSFPLIPLQAQIMDDDSQLATNVSKGKQEVQQGDQQNPALGTELPVCQTKAGINGMMKDDFQALA